MAASGVSAVNKVSEVTAFEVSEFMCCKVTEMQSRCNFQNVIIWIYFLGNKAKGRISKRVFQKNKARQIF